MNQRSILTEAGLAKPSVVFNKISIRRRRLYGASMRVRLRDGVVGEPLWGRLS